VTSDPKGTVGSSSSLLLVGIVRKTHGLDGEVSVEPVTSFPDRFHPGLSVFWQKGSVQKRLIVASVRPHGERLLLAFEGTASMDEARELCGGDLAVAGDQAVVPPEGFYYGHELSGWRCEDTHGAPLGTVAALATTPAGPILEVDTPSKKGALVPFVEGIVVRVDRVARRIVLNPPEGLLDL
jgi:16S rRNA processing protein RimM